MSLSTLTTLATVLVTFGIAQGLLTLALAQDREGSERTALRLVAVALFMFDAIAVLALTV
jgi:hypothetical protein